MANKILVFIETFQGQIKKSSLEAISAAKEISSKINFEVEAVAIDKNIEQAETLSNFGLNKITLLKNDQLENYSPSAFTKILSDHAKEIDADILFFSHTSLGRDLAPRVAVRFEAGITTDCVELNIDGSDIIASRPVFAGKALVETKINSVKKIFTLRPNIFHANKISDANAEIITKEVNELDLSSRVTGIKKSADKIDVAEAEIIVSGGRGLKGPENFHIIEELAETLGAAVGASRAVVDAGWRPHNEQVGQTGKTVSPNLYIAVGISGAIQHLAGMSSSKYIVAINKDKDAPIFSIADYGIIGDALEIVPALTEELKKNK